MNCAAFAVVNSYGETTRILDSSQEQPIVVAVAERSHVLEDKLFHVFSLLNIVLAVSFP